MEWEKAKTYILITFVILNLCLAGLLFNENRRYTLTSDRERTILSVLSQNNINLYTLPMRRFAPMRRLDISGFYYDIDELLPIFFSDPLPTRCEDVPFYSFRTDYSELTITNGFVFFEILDTTAPNINPWLHDEDIFISQHFPDFVEDISFSTFDGERVIFLQEYRGQKIESNSIEFLITDEGITQIEMQFGRVLGHGGDPRMIFAPDEALLTFMQRARSMAEENPIFITRMELVYYKEYASDQPGTVYHAVPFYRIFIRGNDDHPFLINAYTNMIID